MITPVPRQPHASLLVRLDAAYCAGAGLLVVLLAAPLHGTFGVSSAVMRAVGVASIAWAGVIGVLDRRAERRRVLALLAAANGLGAALLGAGTALAAAVTAQVLLALTAVEVGGFAAAQLVSLRREPRRVHHGWPGV
jgi:hypothetical protein